MCCILIEQKIMHFNYMTSLTTLQNKNPCPWDHEIYYFCRPFFGHQYYTLSFYQICAWEQSRRFFKKYINFTLFTPKLLLLGVEGHKINNFGRSLLGHHNYTIILGLSDLCLGVEKKIFKKNISIFHFLPQNYFPLVVGVMEFIIYCLLSLQMLHPKFG